MGQPIFNNEAAVIKQDLKAQNEPEVKNEPIPKDDYQLVLKYETYDQTVLKVEGNDKPISKATAAQDVSPKATISAPASCKLPAGCLSTSGHCGILK